MWLSLHSILNQAVRRLELCLHLVEDTQNQLGTDN